MLVVFGRRSGIVAAGLRVDLIVFSQSGIPRLGRLVLPVLGELQPVLSGHGPRFIPHMTGPRYSSSREARLRKAPSAQRLGLAITLRTLASSQTDVLAARQNQGVFGVAHQWCGAAAKCASLLTLS